MGPPADEMMHVIALICLALFFVSMLALLAGILRERRHRRRERKRRWNALASDIADEQMRAERNRRWSYKMHQSDRMRMN